MKDWREQATPFQRKVYDALLKIPKGQVRTYAQVARMIAKPNPPPALRPGGGVQGFLHTRAVQGWAQGVGRTGQNEGQAE